ncbi:MULTISPECIES: TRAP transporter large permease [Stappia]|uniref:TRAP transporter large permease n=1 Tax=Stappia TaxID=152161 RepID=UPI00082B154F|nr:MULTISPECIES: TRAP transporter large permease [Stappia]MBC2860912.1 TRAP transporter large permease [Stappia sp. 28M-7]MCC4245202.1 TRAP transporter large permease [Stappia indica]
MIEQTAVIALGLIFVLALAGVHIALAFLIGSTVGLYLLFQDWWMTLGLLQQTAFDGIRDYNLMVIPLFAVMGLLIARSGAATDLFSAANRTFSRVPARLAVATVAGNAFFAAVTGVGVAAAATFSHIAYPSMQAAGYRRSFAAGCIAGSSVLGLLIPPSVFMIVWAILTEQSIGRLFAAGVLPGIALAVLFALYCVVRAIRNPQIVQAETAVAPESAPRPDPVGIFGILAIIVVTLGGIWGGFFTPTEGSAVGLAGALLLSLAKGMSRSAIVEATREAGMVVTPIMLLLLGAAMYSKLLALAGIPQVVGMLFETMELGPTGTVLVMAAIWLVLGCFVDSISIMLLTVPLFWPIAQAMGIDAVVFAIVGILVIEAGVLTPPFGIGAFVVLAAIPDKELRLSEVFRGLAPYWIMILGIAVAVYVFPPLATLVPSLL